MKSEVNMKKIYTLEQIADMADVIINGFAVQKIEAGFRVCNLNVADLPVSVFAEDGTLIETDTDGIELELEREYFKKALPFMTEDLYI